MGEGGSIDKLDFTAKRHTIGNARGAYTKMPGHFAEVVGGGFAFDGRVCG